MVDAGFISRQESEPLLPGMTWLGLTSAVPAWRLAPTGLEQMSDAWEEIARCLAAAAH